jgi:hypothetical protein
MLRSSQDRNYGWDVELTCPQCGTSGLPRYEGWSPSLESNSGAHVQVYAKIACPKCGRRLTDEAAKKLVQLFSARDIPAENKKLISRFIARLFLVPAGLAFVLFFGMQMDWWNWGLGTVWILIVSAIAVPMIVLARNRRIAELPNHCACGNAHYVFMGTIDSSHCYRCFSCGQLMKLRE